jgi:hypothetical protein
MKLLFSLKEYRNKELVRQEERSFYYGRIENHCIIYVILILTNYEKTE